MQINTMQNAERSVSPDDNRPVRQRKTSKRFTDYVNTDTNQQKRKPLLAKKNYYSVDKIEGHRVTREKNRDFVELKVYWEGYADPSWEGFTGFVKDAAQKVERYFIRNQIRPYQQIRQDYKKLNAECRQQKE